MSSLGREDSKYRSCDIEIKIKFWKNEEARFILMEISYIVGVCAVMSILKNPEFYQIIKGSFRLSAM